MAIGVDTDYQVGEPFKSSFAAESSSSSLIADPSKNSYTAHYQPTATATGGTSGARLLLQHFDNTNHPFIFETVRINELYTVTNIACLPPNNSEDGMNDAYQSKHGVINTIHALCPDDSDPPYPMISAFSFILPTSSGYVVRSDFLRLRLQDCPIPILKVFEPRRAGDSHVPLNFDENPNIHTIIHFATGIVRWANIDMAVSVQGLRAFLENVTRELGDRLEKAPCLTPEPITLKRVALVRGRPNLTAGGPVYSAAKALGLQLVIISEKGHWLQADTDENRQYREGFIETDMTEDAHTTDRFVAAVKSYPFPIHGIFTLSDNFFVAVAKAARILGFHTSPVSAYETSVNKYKSRLLQDCPGQTAQVACESDLLELLKPSADGGPPAFTPRFPMIVKPVKGWSSECVSKVSNFDDLTVAVKKATCRHGSAAVIEPFFDGPEIDVNFVLSKGRILFWEMADEPPCGADARNATVHDTFSPEALTLPSSLPDQERYTAVETLHKILLKLGFYTGIFHVEARMVNSVCEYQEVAPGVVDLVRKDVPPPGQPECRLLEINARPPGFRVSVPSRHTYGIDYFAVQMLAAVGDHARLEVAAKPFAGPLSGAQYWSRLVYVPAPAAGTVVWPSGLSPCDELRYRRPALAARIVVAVDYCVPGEKVTLFTDGARTYVAHLLVCSRESRLDAIQVANEVMDAFHITVEADSDEVDASCVNQ